MLRREFPFSPFEPLGLQYIQSVLISMGHEVILYDCLIEKSRKIKFLSKENLYRCGSNDQNIIRKIKKFKPDIVGISGMFYAQSDSFYHVADLVKSVSKDIFVIGGGAFPSSYGANVLKDSKGFNAIILGEGEATIVDLVNNLNNLHEVEGICFRDPKSGEIVCTKSRTINMNIDEIALPHRKRSDLYNYSKSIGYEYSDKFDLRKYFKKTVLHFVLFLPIIRSIFARISNFYHKNNLSAHLRPCGFIITSRSCPNKCAFCAIHKVWGNVYRMRSAKSVLDEIDILVRGGAKEIVIIDDNFTVSKERVMAICRGVIERKYNIRLSAPSGIFIPTLDEDVLKALYDAGFRALDFGIENGDQDFLNNVIRKNVNLTHAITVINQAKKIGFYTRAFLIFGFPGETKEIMLKTFRFAFESGIDSARFYIFQPFPGTEAFKMAVEMGAIKEDLDLTRLKVLTDVPQLDTKDFSRDDIKRIHNLACQTLEAQNYEEIKEKLKKILNW